MEDKDLLDYLEDHNVPMDVLMEIKRSKVNPNSATPEILDLDTLMALDNADLTSYSEMTKKEKKMKDLETKPHNLICNRCHHLKHLHELIEYKGPENFEKPGTTKTLAHYVHKMNREKILESIISKMYYKSIVIMVVDMANFEGSLIPEIFDNVNLKKHKLVVVGNKIDALPKGFSVERL